MLEYIYRLEPVLGAVNEITHFIILIIMLMLHGPVQAYQWKHFLDK